MRSITIYKIFFLSFLLLNVVAVSGQDRSKELNKGIKYFNNEKYEKALLHFQKEYKSNPSVHIKFWIAHTYAKMNKIKEAKPLFLEIINIDQAGPEVEMSLVNMGNCYRALKQIDSAHFYYDKAGIEFPNSELAFFNKGQLLYQEGKFEEARKNYDKAIAIKSDYWFYYEKRLEVCFGAEDYKSALENITKVKELQPEAKINFNLAFCLSMLNRYAEADSVFQTIYDEKNPAFLNNYGMNKYNMGKVDEGKKIIMKSLAIKPDNSYAYRNLGVIAVAEKNMDVACQHFKKALELGYEKSYGAEVSELQLKHCK